MMYSSDVFCKVVFLLSNHSVAGEVNLKDRRLSDLLNETRDSVVVLLNATLARLSDPGKIQSRDPSTVLPKTKIMIAFELTSTGIGAKRLYGYQKKRKYHVVMTTESMEIRGFLHATTDIDLRVLAGGQSERFVPVTNAVVTLRANDKLVIEQEVVLVNVHHNEYFSLGDAEPSEE